MGVGDQPPGGLNDRAKVIAGAVIGVLYAIGMSITGAILPGLVGGVLAGVLCFLVLRAVEHQRRQRRDR
jgi:uncharacterized protein (DUF2062 family)